MGINFKLQESDSAHIQLNKHEAIVWEEDFFKILRDLCTKGILKFAFTRNSLFKSS